MYKIKIDRCIMKGVMVMCKLGDIIFVKEYFGSDGKKVNQHSFVVINDKKDFIEGLCYDFVANVMLSFHNEEHKARKLKYKRIFLSKKRKLVAKI